MAGCFGDSPIDRHFQNQLESYLGSDDHHPNCDMAEEGDEFLEDGTPYEKVCTCAEQYESDRCEAELDRMEEEY
jgi:hypothetical protein